MGQRIISARKYYRKVKVMTQLSKEYQEILKDLENNIKDEKELEYVKKQI